MLLHVTVKVRSQNIFTEFMLRRALLLFSEIVLLHLAVTPSISLGNKQRIFVSNELLDLIVISSFVKNLCKGFEIELFFIFFCNKFANFEEQ